MVGLEVGITDLGGCVAILPEVKWTLTFGDLVAAVVPVLAFLAGMYLKQYFWNKEKFNNEYTELARLLRKLNNKVEDASEPRLVSVFTEKPRRKISSYIRNNPMKFESKLEDDWNEVKNPLMQLYQISDSNGEYDQDKFIRKKDKVMEELTWFRNKLKNYYRCHSPGRWKYRITAIPVIVKGWFE